MKLERPPETLPIFPLTGSLLLPGNYLPLNIFEPRYRNLVRDALEGPRLIGMIQPRVPGPDNLGPLRGDADPDLYAVGCVGTIQRCERQTDGRYLIVLRGLIRFRIAEELPRHNGYRLVRPDFGEFGGDEQAEAEGIDTASLLAAVDRFAERYGLDFDADLLASLPPLLLVNALSAALPFSPGERQALLEAPRPADRARLLRELMRMGLDDRWDGDAYRPPVVN
ncbi:MAG: LON peptidase substrate-binding domain-containing protein [Thermoanaerobaculia bacterium]|nr:LON peptidase substrate-binding domain-containing protein [Thermoanaerobaculia bacterium]